LSGQTLNVEDYPLLWIDGTYYTTFKGDTFDLATNAGNDIWAGDAIDYAAVTSISIINQTLTTNFNFLDKFPSLTSLDLDQNSISNIDLSKAPLLTYLKLSGNSFTLIDISTNVLLDDVHFRFNAVNYISLANNVLLQTIRLQSQSEANFLLNLADVISHNVQNGFLGYELDPNTPLFDGVSQGITLTSDITLSGDFEITFTLFYTQSGHLFSDKNGTTRIMITGSKIRFDFSTFNVEIEANLVMNTVLFMKIERIGSTVNVYKNDILQGSGTWSHSNIINVFAKKRGAGTTVPSLGGYMKNIIIDNGGTVYEWAADEGTGTTITDTSQGNNGTLDGSWNGLLTDVTGLSQVETLQSRGWTVVSYNQ